MSIKTMMKEDSYGHQYKNRYMKLRNTMMGKGYKWKIVLEMVVKLLMKMIVMISIMNKIVVDEECCTEDNNKDNIIFSKVR